MLTIQALGNLGGDPEEKTTQSGVRYARFSVATNRKIKGQKVTTWLNCTVFNDTSVDFVMKYLKKGVRVFVEGEPSARAYESNGEAKASLDCTLGFGSKIEIASAPSDNGSSDTDQSGGNSQVDDEEPPF